MELDWSIILRPELYEPTWCVEFVDRNRSCLLASLKTCISSLRPFKFWSRMRLDFPVRVRRLARYLIILCLPFLLAYLLVQTTVAVVVRRNVQVNLERWMAALPAEIAMFEAELALLEANETSTSPQMVQSRFGTKQSISAALDRYQSILIEKPPLAPSYFRCVIDAVIHPTADVEYARSQYPTMFPYPAPNELHWLVWNQWFPTAAAGMSFMRWRNARFAMEYSLGWILAALFVIVAFPLLWILLPVSRKRAKVRWVHLVRIGAYSAIIPIVITWLALIFGVVAAVQEVTDLPYTLMFWVSVPVPSLWIILFWWAAIRCYLKMPHGFLTAVLFTLLAMLLLASALFWVFEMPIWRQLLHFL